MTSDVIIHLNREFDYEDIDDLNRQVNAWLDGEDPVSPYLVLIDPQ